MTMNPKLRHVQPVPTTHAGRAGFVLRDPLALSPRTLFWPRDLLPLLGLCDGTRSLDELSAALLVRFNVRAPVSVLTQLVAQLDQVYLLDNDRFVEAHDAALAAYRNAPSRPLALAGRSYPADAEQLAAYLATFDAPLFNDGRAARPDAGVRAVICPHIDYPRGGRVYAGLWQRAAETARQAELIVVLGTDHHGGGLLTLTRQHYATPWGVLPTAGDAVDALAQAIGEQEALGDELYHRAEHSIELAVVWLHAMLGERRPQLLPVLVGSFQGFIDGQGRPEGHAGLNAVVAALQEIAARRRTLLVAAGDLSHVGPAFGGPPLDFVARAQLKGADDQLLQAICTGDAGAFFDRIQAEGDRRNVCGLPPIYLTLRVLDQSQGQVTGYEVCPADQDNTSSVSVAGVLLW